jgi:peptidoglycan/xylan/chitin deacetylase (PgdA/CDA1 family)
MADATMFGPDRINWPEPKPSEPAPDVKPPAPKRNGRTILSWIIGLLALPLSIVPFVAYAHFDRTGNMLLLRVERYFQDPAAPELSASAAAAYRADALHYQDALAVLAVPEVLDGRGHPHAISTKRFAEHMRMLEAAGYRAVTPDEVVSWLDGKSRLPENALLLTFDGGRADVVLNAAPVLKDVAMPATVFATGGAYEADPVWFASPEQLRGLEQERGWSIEAYSASAHDGVRVGDGSSPYLSALQPGEDVNGFRTRARTEYEAAREAATDMGARSVVAFAWPHGAWGGDRRTNDADVGPVNIEEARRVYRLGFTLDRQDSFRLLTRADDPLRAARLALSPDWTPRELLERLNVAAAASAPEVRDAAA